MNTQKIPALTTAILLSLSSVANAGFTFTDKSFNDGQLNTLFDFGENGQSLIVSQLMTTNEIERKAEQITVLVSTRNQTGSGVLISKNDGYYYVLTAAHNLEEDSTYHVTTHTGKTYQSFAIIPSFPDLDLAVLRFQSPHEYEIAEIYVDDPSSSNPIPGGINFNTLAKQNVYIYGFNSSESTEQGTLSCGIELPSFLSLMVRQSPLHNGYEMVYTNLTYAGFSGGPILDNSGRLIGIHGRSEGASLLQGFSSINLGLSLGIPMQSFTKIIDEYFPEIELSISNQPLANPLSQRSSGGNPCNTIERPDSSASDVEWANYANSLLRQFDLANAISAYDQALSRNSPDQLYYIWHGRGLALLLSLRPNEALNNFERALTLWSEIPTNNEDRKRRQDESKVLLLRFHSMLLQALGQGERGLRGYEQVIFIDPENVQAWVLKANILRSLGRNSEAISAYQEAISISPQPEMFREISRIHLANQNYDLAIESLDNLILFDPDNAYAYATRGAMKIEVGDRRGGRQDYNKVYELLSEFSSDYADSLIRLGELSISNTRSNEQDYETLQVYMRMFSEVLSHQYYGDDFIDIGIVFDNLSSNMPEIFQIMSEHGQVFSDLSGFEDLDSFPDFHSPEYLLEIANILQESGFLDGMDLNDIQASILEISNIDREILNLGYFISAAFQQLPNIQNSPRIPVGVIRDKVEMLIPIARDTDSEHLHILYSIRSAFYQNEGNLSLAERDLERALVLQENDSSHENHILRGTILLMLENKSLAISAFVTAAEDARNNDDQSSYFRLMVILDFLQHSDGL